MVTLWFSGGPFDPGAGVGPRDRLGRWSPAVLGPQSEGGKDSSYVWTQQGSQFVGVRTV